MCPRTFPGESVVTPDKILCNCCNSAGCWHCLYASAELKHWEVYFSYFIWIDSYHHKGIIFILGQYLFYLNIFSVKYSERPCMKRPCDHKGGAARGGAVAQMACMSKRAQSTEHVHSQLSGKYLCWGLSVCGLPALNDSREEIIFKC